MHLDPPRPWAGTGTGKQILEIQLQHRGQALGALIILCSSQRCGSTPSTPRSPCSDSSVCSVKLCTQHPNFNFLWKLYGDHLDLLSIRKASSISHSLNVISSPITTPCISSHLLWSLSRWLLRKPHYQGKQRISRAQIRGGGTSLLLCTQFWNLYCKGSSCTQHLEGCTASECF